MKKRPHLLLSLLATLLTTLAPLSLCAEEGETSSSLATYTYDLHAGWNLIGLILDPDQASQEALRALIPYDYDGTAFCKAKETVPGAAYWVYTETARELVVNGYPLGQLVPGESDPDPVTGAYQMAELVDALPGTQVTRFAPDLDGYVFIGWSAEGIDLSGEAAAANPLTFTMPECRVILTPHYAVAYKLTVDGEFLRKAQSAEAISVGVPEKEGHSFGEWIVEGVTDYSVAEDTHAISFAMPANDVTLTRVYTVNNYNLAVDDGSAESPAVTPTAYGASVELNAAEKDGRAFSEWTASGIALADAKAPEQSFAMPANDVEMTANYTAVTYKLSVSADGGEAATESVACGASVEKAAPASEGRKFSKWTITGLEAASSADNPIKFTMPAGDVTLDAEYNANAYALSVTGGKAPQASYEYGADVVVEIVTPEGFSFKDWTVVGVASDKYAVNAETHAISFTMPANDVSLTANYTANDYSLTVDNGTPETVAFGTAVEKTAAVVEGKTFEKWTITGLEATTSTVNPIKFTMPAGNVTLSASYTANKYILTVDGTGAETEYGTGVQKTPAAVEGKTFKDWTVVGLASDKYTVAETTHTISFTMPANDVSLTANYTANDYSLTVDNGTPETVAFGAAVEKTAAVVEGKTFEKWTITGLEAATSTANPIKFTMPAGNVTLTASYTANKYNLTVAGGSAGASSYDYGATATATAGDPAPGYAFGGWTSFGIALDESQRTTTPLSFTMPANDVSLTANYSAITYNLTVDGGAAEAVAFGDVVSRTAVPEAGMSFVKWSVSGLSGITESANNPFVFTMPANDVSLTPNFVATDYLLTVKAEGLDDKSEAVAYSTPVSKSVPVRAGHVFSKWTVSGLPDLTESTNNPIEFNMPLNDVTLTANYTANEYNLTVDGGEPESYNYGAEVEKEAAAVDGKTFQGWQVAGSDGETAAEVGVTDTTANPIVFSMPACDVSLNSLYAAIDYTLTIDGIPWTKRCGDAISVTAPDKSGYTFAKWTKTAGGEDPVESTDNPIAFAMPADNVTLATTYTANEVSVTVNGEVQEGVKCGDELTVTAPYKRGYKFQSWSINGAYVEDPTQKEITITVGADPVTLTPLYDVDQEAFLVVELTGDNAGAFTYSATGPDLDDDACRTTQLWLQRIPAGTFTMGSPKDEVGRGTDETQHEVTLTEEFYIGIFEMTQKQYENIYGNNPSFYKGDTRPVEFVTYEEIRGSSTGAGWPSSHDVDSNSFLGKFRAKTKLAFDLPTEAQWEYACRAGTTTALNTGKNLTSAYQDSAMDEAGRYLQNSSDGKGGSECNGHHTKVGCYLPNSWGLYDMHGNVDEWCLDWYGDYSGDATDPVGSASGSERVQRGGSYNNSYAGDCRSARRDSCDPDWRFDYSGFRVVVLSSLKAVTVNGETSFHEKGDKVSVTVPTTDSAGGTFSEWEATGVELTEEQKNAESIEVTVGDDDITLTAVYVYDYCVAYIDGDKKGTVEYLQYNDSTFKTEVLAKDDCRTTQLWLRKIKAGSFTMGSPTGETGHSDSETQHQVTLTEDFYIGVFEMTQQQYTYIYGSNPSNFNTADGHELFPVESVSYNGIRGSSSGAGWPSPHDVDVGSFLDKLRILTGSSLCFDLPTEAQWEYACRAGTTTAYSWGDTCSTDKCNYSDSSKNSPCKTGSYDPNGWGLYDMHGNVDEWCLDWYGDYSGDATDPVGPTSGSNRVSRSGNWYGNAQSCRSATRLNYDPSNTDGTLGFRVVLLPSLKAVTVNGETSFHQKGDTVSATAPENPTGTFTEWIATGVTLTEKERTSKSIEITVGDNPVSLTASYTGDYCVVYLDGDKKGTVEYLQYNDSAFKTEVLAKDDCRTTQLWLRKIPAGSFTMGSPETETGRGADETQHQVTLNEDFYIGVFEMTQQQYTYIYGSNPSSFNSADGHLLFPVEKVSYNGLRGSSSGAGWPSPYDVDDGSFLDKLRTLTGSSLCFDLPTEAQWECACRAGTTTAYTWGDMCSTDRCNYTDSGKSSTCKVGSYVPNSWGLYDMPGNVSEWCLDWYGDYSGDATDPAGPASGSNRVSRGGSWDGNGQSCRSASRNNYGPSNTDGSLGFRVVLLPSLKAVTVNGKTFFYKNGDTVSVTVPTSDSAGGTFSEWEATGVTLTEEQKKAESIEVTVGEEDVTLTSVYAYEYCVAYLDGDKKGTVEYKQYTDSAFKTNVLANDDCRTTQLWLRKIPAGSFTMGSPETETGRGSSETQHVVTLSEGFYIGVFEMTQQQYTYIYGSNPSSFNTAEGHELFPVEQVSYNGIRGSSTGARWPSTHDVDGGSFLDKLRSLTGSSLCFDLPTEAQWEYACRAGSTTAYSWGDACSADKCNYTDSGKNSTCKVGSYEPNGWGLYDMHGNVDEWCLDWYGDYSGDATDPAGPASGSNRVSRGGSWNGNAQSCRSANRSNYGSSNADSSLGFRVVVQLLSKAVTVNGVTSFYKKGDTASVTAPTTDSLGGTFSEWNATGVTLTEEQKKANPVEITVGDADVTLTSVYAYQYCVVYLDGDKKGTVEYKQYTDTAFKSNVLANNDCRTTQLWLRKIKAGTFTMGSPTSEAGRLKDEVQHTVTLTTDFYIGIFETTQQQYIYIDGHNPSDFTTSDDSHLLFPVERVKYDDIRGSSDGAKWPLSHDVDALSFFGKLRSMTGSSLCFDLPTEAQWEYACRAGTTTAYSWGDTCSADKCNYSGSGKGTTCKVGSYAPNGWGLYDMHGNVYEWCLDWCGKYSGDATDPKGKNYEPGLGRVVRGGSWYDGADCCRSAYRNYWFPESDTNYIGFRVVLFP